MAYDELLHDRIRRAFRDKQVNAEEKYMMGGVCYLVDRKMCAGIVSDQLMVRIAPEIYDEALKKPGCRVMDFTKRPKQNKLFHALNYGAKHTIFVYIKAADFHKLIVKV